MPRVKTPPSANAPSFACANRHPARPGTLSTRRIGIHALVHGDDGVRHDVDAAAAAALASSDICTQTFGTGMGMATRMVAMAGMGGATRARTLPPPPARRVTFPFSRSLSSR